MNTFWISTVVVIFAFIILFPEDTAIATDLFIQWLGYVKTWPARIGFLVRSNWDRSQLAWWLWVARKRSSQNRNNKTEVNE